jgi:hypothetical protein
MYSGKPKEKQKRVFLDYFKKEKEKNSNTKNFNFGHMIKNQLNYREIK